MSRLRSKIKQGKGGKSTLTYLEALLRDPCVYCQEFGCDSFDHIVPIAWIDRLNTGQGKNHWSNLAPCHRTCNMRKGTKGVLDVILGKLPEHLDKVAGNVS
jgi:5-methylcytosine-specific restriction endonuclease McrA